MGDPNTDSENPVLKEEQAAQVILLFMCFSTTSTFAVFKFVWTLAASLQSLKFLMSSCRLGKDQGVM